MAGVDRDLATFFGEVFRDELGLALAEVGVGIGQRDRLYAMLQQDVGGDFAFAGVRRCGAEEQSVILVGRERGRGRRRRDHHDAVRARDVLQDGTGHARAVAADDALDAIGRHHALSRGLRNGGVGAGGVAAHGDKVPAIRGLARGVHFGHRQFGGRSHLRRQRFDGAGKADQHTQLHVFSHRSARHRRHGDRGKKQFFHSFLPCWIVTLREA